MEKTGKRKGKDLENKRYVNFKIGFDITYLRHIKR